MLTRRSFTRLSLATLGLSLPTCSRLSNQLTTDITPVSEEADLLIWWEIAYLLEENERIIQLVKGWEKQSGLKASLKLMPVELLEQELLKSVKEPQNYQVPDIVYSLGVDTNLAPQLAWRDKLTEISDVLHPVQDRYTPTALSLVSYHNQARNEKGYYALPLWQSDDYIHYWSNLLEVLGLTKRDIPTQWHEFWKFWQIAQDQLRARGFKDLYGLGLCMSTSGFDTFASLTLFLDAYNFEVADRDGNLLLSSAANRQRFVEALEEFTNFYRTGYVPSDAVEWTGSGNNTSFLEGRVLMTHNLTLSIPLTQRLERNEFNRDAAKRYREILTIERPRKPNGQEMLTRKGIKQAILPKAGRNQKAAKSFLAYLTQPQILNQLIKGFQGRLLPVMPQLLNDPFWQDAGDPHLSTALKIYNRPSTTPYEVLHPSFSEVQSQQIWAKIVLKVLQEKTSPAVAVDWGIAQIQQIWQNWEGKA